MGCFSYILTLKGARYLCKGFDYIYPLYKNLQGYLAYIHSYVQTSSAQVCKKNSYKSDVKIFSTYEKILISLKKTLK